MFNEAEHIENLVADIAAQDFEGELEILVADGNSTDDCVARLQASAERHGLPVTVLPTPRAGSRPGSTPASSGARVI
jgi:glycosyltransferase involved in cell wall biosynthesis